MEKIQKHTHNAPQHENNWLTIIGAARSKEYRELTSRVEAGPHPRDEMLHDHVWDRLDADDSRIIREHNAFCRACAEKVLRLRLIKQESQEDFLAWANEPCRIARPQSGTLIETFVSTERLAALFWEPEWVGQTIAAADMPSQGQNFSLDEGSIKLSCTWQPKFRKHPAHIGLNWEADLKSRRTISALFLRPDSLQETPVEIVLGNELHGDTIIGSDQLGFDPSLERWAVALLLRGDAL